MNDDHKAGAWCDQVTPTLCTTEPVAHFILLAVVRDDASYSLRSNMTKEQILQTLRTALKAAEEAAPQPAAN